MPDVLMRASKSCLQSHASKSCEDNRSTFIMSLKKEFHIYKIIDIFRFLVLIFEFCGYLWLPRKFHISSNSWQTFLTGPAYTKTIKRSRQEPGENAKNISSYVSSIRKNRQLRFFRIFGENIGRQGAMPALPQKVHISSNSR